MKKPTVLFFLNMGTGLKIILGAVAVGVIALLVKGRQAVNQFTFDIIGYGIPKISNWVLSVPLQLRFNNPLPTPIPLQRFEVNLFMLQGGNTWQQIGRIDQPITIDSGISEKTITPVVDLKSFFQNNFIETLHQTLTNAKVQVRADITVTAPGGITLPTQSEVLDLNLLMNAA